MTNKMYSQNQKVVETLETEMNIDNNSIVVDSGFKNKLGKVSGSTLSPLKDEMESQL